ncbi:MAG: hypothetical protein RR458_04165, partial [Clostridia bacterium]
MIRRLFSLQNIAFATLFFIFVTLVISPAVYAKECFKGFEMWARFVLPSLFPFFFLTKIMTSFSLVTRFANFLSPVARFFNAPPLTSYIMLMSYISGYPIGAKLISEFYESGQLSETQAENISILCSTSGIPFVLGSVGGLMLQSQAVALSIYFSQIIASLVVGYFMCRTNKSSLSTSFLPLKSANLDSVLSDSIHSSVMSILIVGGYISLFYVLLKVVAVSKLLFPLEFSLNALFAKFNLSNFGTYLIKGFFEVTTGCYAFATHSNKIVVGGFMTAIIAFGGLSINMQSLTFLTKAKIKPVKFLLQKSA